MQYIRVWCVGCISLEEFEEAWKLVSQHRSVTFTTDEVHRMATNIDLNRDGQIDFNEFLEAFRIVDQLGREHSITT